MKITIEGEAKEIAALVLELQERPVGNDCKTNSDGLADKIIRDLQRIQAQGLPIIVP